MAEVQEKDDRYMHSRLPIGKDEKILAIYRHHWFAYASIWFVGIVIVLILIGMAFFLTSSGDTTTGLAKYRSEVISGTLVFSLIVLAFTGVPVWLRSQEQVVLTEEALLQLLQPSIFSNKVSQINLNHIADVSVRQDFFGTILGYGKISIESPGEQDNYEFFSIPKPQAAAKEIIEAHENFIAALNAGRMHTTLGEAQPAAPQIDMAQYQQFLAFQQAQAAQAQQNGQSQPPASDATAAAPQSSPAAEPSMPTDNQPAASEDESQDTQAPNQPAQ